MSDELRKRLQEILLTNINVALDFDEEGYKKAGEIIDQIDAAYREAGYTNARSYNLYGANGGSEPVKLDTLMTDQEWYDRFKIELVDDPHDAADWYREPYERAYEVAQRAAGITEGDVN